MVPRERQFGNESDGPFVQSPPQNQGVDNDKILIRAEDLAEGRKPLVGLEGVFGPWMLAKKGQHRRFSNSSSNRNMETK